MRITYHPVVCVGLASGRWKLMSYQGPTQSFRKLQLPSNMLHSPVLVILLPSTLVLYAAHLATGNTASS